MAERTDREIIDAASPGEWESGHYHDDQGCPDYGVFSDVRVASQLMFRDAEFIAAARTRWPAALDRIDQLEGRVKELEGALRHTVQCIDDFDCAECRAALALLDQNEPDVVLVSVCAICGCPYRNGPCPDCPCSFRDPMRP